MAVKAALVRGRQKLQEQTEAEGTVATSARAELNRYASLFNARDWEGVRALVGDDCRLDLVSRSQRRGKQVGYYFTRYENTDLRLQLVRLEGQLALAAFAPGVTQPAYFILMEFEAGQVKFIRDFRYVPYIASEADFELVT